MDTSIVGVWTLQSFVMENLDTAVDVAWFETWVGTEQERTYLLDGDRLELRTPPGRMPREGAEDVTVVGVLSWVRERP